MTVYFIIDFSFGKTTNIPHANIRSKEKGFHQGLESLYGLAIVCTFK